MNSRSSCLAVLFFVVAALTSTRPAHAYSDDPAEIAIRNDTARAITPVQLDIGGKAIQSEYAFWDGVFATFENPNVALPLRLMPRSRPLFRASYGVVS